MEQKIVQRLCPESAVRRIGCNGKDADMAVMARFLLPQISLLRRYRPIIILFDRERRKENARQLKTELLKILMDSTDYADLVIGIPNPTTENWILAGWDGVRNKYPTYPEYFMPSKPKNGKAEIKKLLPKGELYTETILGPKLFAAADPAKMYQNDESFREFVDALALGCYWLERIRQG